MVLKFSGIWIEWLSGRGRKNCSSNNRHALLVLVITFVIFVCNATENDRSVINKEIITNFLEDSTEIGVKAVSFVSDGESTISPAFIDGVKVES